MPSWGASADVGGVVGVVLAAGASRRTGGAKALALLEGRTFVERIAGCLRDGGCRQVIVVVGPPHEARVAEALAGAAALARNPDPDKGMSSSLQVGLAAARDHGSGAAVVALVDHPGVRATTVRAVIDAWSGQPIKLVRPSFRGARGHPFLVASSLFDDLLSLPAGADPRPVLRAATPQLDLPVDDPAVLDDLDTVAAIVAAGGTPDPSD